MDVLAALRQQRQIIGEKREHLDRAIRAIERAEQAASSGSQTDWEPFRKIIEVIQMQTRKDWMKKYYTEEQLTDPRKRWSPEVQAESEREWNELIRDTEAAIARGEDPSSGNRAAVGGAAPEVARPFHGWGRGHGRESAETPRRPGELAGYFQEAL
jgi:hypothetical protein